MPNSRNRALRLATGPILLVVSVGVCILLGEASVWLVHNVIRDNPRLLRADTQLGWANREHFQGRFHRGDGETWEVTTDSLGRRVLDVSDSKVEQRIMLLGDSFVFGDSMDERNHFAAILADSVAASITNLGVVGYATDQQYIAFKQTTDRDSDVLILMTYLGNDLRDNLTHFQADGLRFKPKFVAEGTDFVGRDVPHQFANWMRHQSYLMTLLIRVLYAFDPDRALFDSPEKLMSTSAPVENYLSNVELIFEEAQARGISQFIIVYWSMKSAMPNPAIADALNQRFGNQLDVVELDRIFRERGALSDGMYFEPEVDPGMHWNEAGHLIVAQVLEDVLRD